MTYSRGMNVFCKDHGVNYNPNPSMDVIIDENGRVSQENFKALEELIMSGEPSETSCGNQLNPHRIHKQNRDWFKKHLNCYVVRGHRSQCVWEVPDIYNKEKDEWVFKTVGPW